MCLPPTMVTGGLLGHTMAKANEPDKDPQTINNYYGQAKTEQEDPIVKANKVSQQKSPGQTSQTDRAY